MQNINLADMKTYALMNNISVNEAKKLVGEKIRGTNDTFDKKTKESNFTDSFSSSSVSQFKNPKEEIGFYENFFANNNKEEKISSEIENMAKNPEIIGKSASDTAKFFANEFDISEEDAKEIFTEDFINDVLGIETSQEPENEENDIYEEEDIVT